MKKRFVASYVLIIAIASSMALSLGVLNVAAVDPWDPNEDYVLDSLGHAASSSTYAYPVGISTWENITHLSVNLTCTEDSFLYITYHLEVRLEADEEYQFQIWVATPNGYTADYTEVKHQGGSDTRTIVSWSYLVNCEGRGNGEYQIRIQGRSETNSGDLMVMIRRMNVMEFVPKSASAGEFGGITLAVILALALVVTAIPHFIRFGKRKRTTSG